MSETTEFCWQWYFKDIIWLTIFWLSFKLKIQNFIRNFSFRRGWRASYLLWFLNYYRYEYYYVSVLTNYKSRVLVERHHRSSQVPTTYRLKRGRGIPQFHLNHHKHLYNWHTVYSISVQFSKWPQWKLWECYIDCQLEKAVRLSVRLPAFEVVQRSTYSSPGSYTHIASVRFCQLPWIDGRLTTLVNRLFTL